MARQQPIVSVGHDAAPGLGHQSGAVFDRFILPHRLSQKIDRQREKKYGD
jgi:hypothetical protein